MNAAESSSTQNHCQTLALNSITVAVSSDEKLLSFLKAHFNIRNHFNIMLRKNLYNPTKILENIIMKRKVGGQFYEANSFYGIKRLIGRNPELEANIKEAIRSLSPL